MLVRIVLFICVLPAVLMMYAAFAGMGNEQNNSLFGLTLWHGAMEEEPVQKLVTAYRRQMRYLLAAFLLLHIVVYLPKHFSIMLILWLIWLFAALAGMGIPYVMANKKLAAMKKERGIVHEEDEHWRWGMVYQNEKDKRFWVAKKVGIGYSMNMAKPAAKVFAAVTALILLVICIGSGVLVVLDEFTPVRLEYENSQLTARHWKEEYRIDKTEIASVTLLEELPRISKIAGTGMENVYKGKFFSREYDRRFRACLNPEEEPVLMIETRDGTWYLLGDSNADQTKEIYTELIKD